MLANQYKLVVIDNTAKAHLDDVRATLATRHMLLKLATR